MIELKRLADSPEGAELLPLLRAARAYEPPPGAAERALERLTFDVAASAAATSPLARLSSHAKWLAASGAFLTIGVLVGTGALAPSPRAATDVTASPSRLAPSPLPAEPASVPSAAPPAPLPSSSPSSRVRAVPLDSKPGSRSTLAEELALMDRARRELARGAPRETLRLLDEYARDFPRPSFGAEAQVTRVEALLAVGQRAQAVELARKLLERQPRGVHAKRVRQLLGERPDPAGAP